MESSVFTYFFAIGAGLASGIGVVVLAGYWLLNKIKRGGSKNVRNTSIPK